MKSSILKMLLATAALSAAFPLAAQEKRVLGLLNKALAKEARHLLRDEYNDGTQDTLLLVVQPFMISGGKVLTVEVKTKVHNGFRVVRQEVSLDKIVSLLKDINVIFETAGDDVTVTSTTVYNDGTPSRAETYQYHLFFLNLSSGLQSGSWQDDVVAAFARAGFRIRKEIWAD